MDTQGGRPMFRVAPPAPVLRNWPFMLSKLLPLAMVCASQALPQGNNLPPRETLSYSIEWRLVTAGKARLEWNGAQPPRPGWQIRLHLESVGLVSKLFKVEDDYSASLNQSLCILSSQLIAHEGSRNRDTRITFDYEGRKASYLERDLVKNATLASREIDLPSCTHDVIGGLYHLRTLNLEPGQSIQAPVSDGKKAVVAKIEAQQREEIKVPDGTYKTIRYEIFLFDSVLYRRSGHLYVWLSDDRRKLPVQIRARMAFTVGTITFQLEKHE
jgi:hypothetical protein